jgi:hypothetical protein
MTETMETTSREHMVVALLLRERPLVFAAFFKGHFQLSATGNAHFDLQSLSLGQSDGDAVFLGENRVPIRHAIYLAEIYPFPITIVPAIVDTGQ